MFLSYFWSKSRFHRNMSLARTPWWWISNKDENYLWDNQRDISTAVLIIVKPFYKGKYVTFKLNQKLEPARTEATCWNLASEMEECPNTATPNTSVYLMTDFHVSLFRNLWYFGYLVFGIFVGFFCIFLGHFNTLGRRPLGWSSEGRWAHCHCLQHLRKTIIWKYSGKFHFKKRLIGVSVNSTNK